MKSSARKSTKVVEMKESQLKSIAIQHHPIWKVTDEELAEGEEAKNTRPLSTIDLIKSVLKKEEKGPHGEPAGFTGAEQFRYFRILNILEDLPADAKTVNLKEADHSFIVKKLKDFKWVRPDQFFVDFELSMGITYDDK